MDWIDVKDRLPENENWHFVFIGTDRKPDARIAWYNLEDQSWLDAYGREVNHATHWASFNFPNGDVW